MAEKIWCRARYLNILYECETDLEIDVTKQYPGKHWHHFPFLFCHGKIIKD